MNVVNDVPFVLSRSKHENRWLRAELEFCYALQLGFCLDCLPLAPLWYLCVCTYEFLPRLCGLGL
jgi:hypothetical protein